MMRVSVTSMILVVVAAAAFAPKCHAQGWEALVPAIAEKLTGLWENGELELLGHYCNFYVEPKFRNWQLRFKGRMWCPGWTIIKGEADTRSRSGVVGKTIQDFVKKAFSQGLITEEEARAWLSQ
ncbi:anti-lipopolysaccharide factor-like [Penaeus japonicus]|uniref:ALF-C1 n=1 Tax=Penaeus japonicus TaxID=27405 RepID=Q1XI22_PENJP|nr:anti-lipopolysaccharide factor-like [Penaeus japonicus]ANA91279.1 ALF-C1 [Penaeus japonicus]BAE92940.1 anti-lipopolysaccharide factor like protein [Penaeus japonicus]